MFLQSIRRLTIVNNCNTFIYQCLSTDLKKISKLNIDLLLIQSCHINLTTAWQDHAEFIKLPLNNHITYDESNHLCNIQFESKGNEEINDIIDIIIPEMCDLNIIGNNIHLNISKKLLGDLSVSCKSGKVSIDKVRGEHITFLLGDADLSIIKLLESNNGHIDCRNLTAKMINGDNIAVESTDSVSVEAMYPINSTIHSNGLINISLLRGHINAVSTEGDILISNIDGSFDVNAEVGRVDLQINKLFNGSKSTARSMKSIGVKVDPSIDTFVSCESNASVTRGSITITSDAFTQDENIVDKEGINNVITGVIKGSSKDISSNNRSGKINLSGAASQSLSNISSSDTNNTDYDDSLPIIEFYAKGHIRVETLSWMDVIRRKHGVDSKISANNKIKLGRTASATQRAQDFIQLQLLAEQENDNTKPQ